MANRSDDFNRADNSASLGTPSDGGSAWVAAAGTFGIQTNKAAKISSDSVWQTAYLEASTSSADVQGTITTNSANSLGLCARLADNNNFLMGYVSPGNAYLFKRVGGTFTQIGTTYTGGFADQDVLKLTIDGSNNIALYKNGSSIKTGSGITDGSTNTKHGLVFFNTTSVRVDDFSITDTGAAVYIRPNLSVHSQSVHRASRR